MTKYNILIILLVHVCSLQSGRSVRAQRIPGHSRALSERAMNRKPTRENEYAIKQRHLRMLFAQRLAQLKVKQDSVIPVKNEHVRPQRKYYKNNNRVKQQKHMQHNMRVQQPRSNCRRRG